jgi:transposase
MPKPATKTMEAIPYATRDRRQCQRFSPEYKARILGELDACASQGYVGALLRRKGLQSSHLTERRTQVLAHGLGALEAKGPGRRAALDDRDRAIKKLEHDKSRPERDLDLARSMLDLVDKAQELLVVALLSFESKG